MKTIALAGGGLADPTRKRSMAAMFRAASEKHKMLLGIVQTPEDLSRCPQLAARDFFTNVEHAVLGRGCECRLDSEI